MATHTSKSINTTLIIQSQTALARSCDCHVTNLFGFEVVLVVVVAQSAVASLAPSKQGPFVGDAGAVRGATGSIHHKVAAQVVHQVGCLQVTGWGEWHTIMHVGALCCAESVTMIILGCCHSAHLSVCSCVRLTRSDKCVK